MKVQPVHSGQISPYDNMGKSVFIPESWDMFPQVSSLQITIDFYWFENVCFVACSVQIQMCLFFFHKMMKFYKGICSFLIDLRQMRHKNTIEISMINWNVLLWIFSNWHFPLIFFWKHVLKGKETKICFSFWIFFCRVEIITSKFLQVSFTFKFILCSA